MSPQKTYTVDEAQKAMERYCAYQERCHKEVEEKLKGMNMIPQARSVIITQLIQDNFLNEERFAKAYALGKFRIKKWGKVRITRELKLRDISKYNIDTALKQLDSTQYQKTFYELAEKKLKNIKETNPWKTRKKLADYLLYRGWESHLVYEVVQDLIP